MKIAVNLLPFREKLAGAGRYAQKILKELVDLDNSNQYYLFISEIGKVNFNFSKSNINYIIADFNPESVLSRIFYEQFIFPIKLRKLKPDIIFTPSVAIPAFYKGRFYTTIHDLAYKRVKNKYPLLRRIYVAFVTNLAVSKSEIIFTVSNFSKKELIEEFGDKKQIIVTYNAVDENFFRKFSEEEKISFRKKYNLPEKYFLYVGAIEPGKNLDKLFLAFGEFLRENPDYFLAITSGIKWKENELLGLIYKLDIEKNIILLPYISELELPLLYRCSKALTYLSSYEGFGLPVLEAMAAETAVITSKSEAIKEFSQDSVFSVNPVNVEEIIEAFNRIINYESEVKEKIVKSKSIAEKFRWKNSAQIILEQFNKID
ncbi:MAG: glycosyltransferase family 4 protein [Ignavibacterium sp.]|nr:glycosyltransferase family 4 protein [Ignavibacterium sp.]